MTIDNNEVIKQATEFGAKISKSQKDKGFKDTHLHIYTDKDGKFIYAKPRLKNFTTGDKYIRSISPNSIGKWQMKDPEFDDVYPEGSGKKPIYRLHELVCNPEAVVYIFEGEQKVDLANELGFIATTSGGSTQIDNYYWQSLSGRTVYLWADNDAAGAKWLTDISKVLKIVGAYIHIIDVGVLGLAEKDDIVDWVDLQRQACPDITNEKIATIIKKLPTFTDEQLLMLLADDIAEPSIDILPQDDRVISSELAQVAINQMAILSELDYQLTRVSKAKALNNMSVGVLDRLVKQARSELDADSASSLVIDTEPYSEPVDGAAVADEIYQTISEHIACTEAVLVAVTLWIIFTWVLGASYIAPIAWINAPEKRCGKSQLLTLMARMSKGTLPTSNITPSALFRCIEKYQPTLFIDEADTFINDNEDLRGVLNAGHSRDNPYIIRCQGDDNEPKPFNVYGAKAISGIGKISGTLMDRSISLTLRRKLKNEYRSRVRDLSRDITDTIKAKLARWSDDNLLSVKAATPALPEAINDRMQDNWEILLKIAEVLGDDWLQRANSACIEISGIEHDEPSLNEQLLTDIKTIFEARKVLRLLTKDLLIGLCSDPEMSWATYNRGKPITPRQISNRLAEYHISSKDIRTGNGRGKGYDIADFKDAFTRYLSADSNLSATRRQVNDINRFEDTLSVTDKDVSRMEETSNPLQGISCHVVTDINPQPTTYTVSDTDKSNHNPSHTRGVI